MNRTPIAKQTNAQLIRLIEQVQVHPGRFSEDICVDLVEEIVRRTSAAYEAQSANYRQLRSEDPAAWDLPMTTKLLELARERFAAPWKMLDVGAGYGRDVRYFAKESDINIFALEICESFVESLLELADDGFMPRSNIIESDMRDLSCFTPSSFECVRNHASLHHLPLLPVAVGVDEALDATRTVLVDGGLFYVTVKMGQGIELLDTNEGLGARFFQYFDNTNLTDALSRHRMKPVHLEQRTENRPSGRVEWLFCIAEAI